MSSTTAIGNAFRDTVCELLRTKYPDAQVEQYISGTKVDISYSMDDGMGGRELVAVECKDYDEALTKSFIATEIYPTYNVMLSGGHVQKVLIVSRKPLGAAAFDYVKGWRGATHRTFDELSGDLLGLGAYLKALANRTPTGDGEYIETRLDGHEEAALAVVQNWVRGQQGHGAALLGSYGQGKTSFANRLAAHYATLHASNPSERMPILVRLGEVVHEMQLEGLFGKMFTAQHWAPGYCFVTLEHLNKAGRLLVILDGFDEMKHAMTSLDFQSNLREFNRLLTGKAKVVLLGRPNAVPDDERDWVFRGLRKIAGQLVPSMDFSPWREERLAFFNLEESTRLLKSKLQLLIDRGACGSPSIGFVEERTAEVLREIPEDLLRRPVHLNIIAELAANPDFNLAGFNEYSLYEHCIRSMIERDIRDKPARRSIPLEARIQFQYRLAWWAWNRGGVSQGHFNRYDIPASLMVDLPPGNASDEAGKRNEYIVSTLTEEKESGVLYFAHRSFQEFLVAERVRETQTSPSSHVEYSRVLTPDILQFLLQAPKQEFIFQWYETLKASRGPIGAGYLEFFASFPRLVEHIVDWARACSASELDAWSISILFYAHRAIKNAVVNSDLIVPIFLGAVRDGQQDAGAVATLALMDLNSKNSPKVDMPVLIASLLERCLSVGELHQNGDSLLIPHGRKDFATNWMKTVVKQFPVSVRDGEASLKISLDALERACIDEIAPGASREGSNPLGDLPTELRETCLIIPAQRVYQLIDEDLRKGCDAYLKKQRPRFGVVEVGAVPKAASSAVAVRLGGR